HTSPRTSLPTRRSSDLTDRDPDIEPRRAGHRFSLLKEGDVEQHSDRQDYRGQDRRPLVPDLGAIIGLRRQAVDESAQLVVRTRARDETYHNGDDEAGDPRRDRRPESLAELAAVDDMLPEVSAFHSGDRARCQ